MRGMRLRSELDILGTSARIVDTFKRPAALADEAQRTVGASSRGGTPSMSGVPSALGNPPTGDALATAGANPARSPKPASCRSPTSTSLDVRQEGSAPNWTGCAVPKAAGKYPKIYPLVGLCKAAGLPIPTPELEWHPTRRYRADYGFPMQKVLIEYDGGLFVNGGHTRGAARRHDMEKDRAATLLGFRTLRYEPDDMNQTVADLLELFA